MLSAGGHADLVHYGVPISGYAMQLRLCVDRRFCSDTCYSLFARCLFRKQKIASLAPGDSDVRSGIQCVSFWIRIKPRAKRVRNK